MTTALKKRLKGLSESYLRLVREFSLYPIGTGDEYDRAAGILERLVMKDDEELDAGEKRYRDALELLIEAYDDEHYPAPAEGTVVERLKALMSANGIGVSDLGAIIGSVPAASMVLNRKRELSKRMIRALAERFNLEPGYFF
jgi:HTH-type transcriptional regulator / antitoxin HigA